VYNVAGPPPVPLSVLARGTGRTAIPIPEPLFRHAVGRFGLAYLPPGAALHVKHPIVVDGAAFRKATGFEYKHDAHEIMRGFRDA
jgi:UDP-glucose 4-epimerase